MIPPGTVSEAYVGRDRATLIGMSDGTVDVITTVHGDRRTSWHVPQDEVAEMLRERRFTLRHAVWSEPTPTRASR
jgi:hypothetical protein